MFYGTDADEEGKAAIRSFLASEHSDIELYEIEGAQPVYPYILIAE